MPTTPPLADLRDEDDGAAVGAPLGHRDLLEGGRPVLRAPQDVAALAFGPGPQPGGHTALVDHEDPAPPGPPGPTSPSTR